HPGARRQGQRLGQQEDRLRRGRRLAREQVRQSPPAGRSGAGRGRLRRPPFRRSRSGCLKNRARAPIDQRGDPCPRASPCSTLAAPGSVPAPYGGEMSTEDEARNLAPRRGAPAFWTYIAAITAAGVVLATLQLRGLSMHDFRLMA